MKGKKSKGRLDCDWFTTIATVLSVLAFAALLWVALDRFHNTRTGVWPIWSMVPVRLSGVCTGERSMYFRAKPETWVMERGALACTVQTDMNNTRQWLGITLPRGTGLQSDQLQWAVATNPQAYPPFLQWSRDTNMFTIQWPPMSLKVGHVVDLVAAIEVFPPPPSVQTQGVALS